MPIGGVPGVRGLSISADGKTLAFSGVSLSSHIWAQPLGKDGAASGAPRAITSDTSRRNSLPTISPDGSRIAYMSTRGGAAPDLWVMDADGGNPHLVAVNDLSEPRLGRKRWMPDGRRLAYVTDRDRTLDVRAIHATTRREELLFSYRKPGYHSEREGLRGSVGQIHIAPSMTQIAFSLLTPPDGRRRIYVAGLNDVQPQALTADAVSVGYPSWSPDERQIAVELKDGSSTHAAIIDASNGALRRLTNARGQTWVRSWSPDGRQIAAAVLRDGRWSLRAIDAANGSEKTITTPSSPNVYVRYPDWSPKGDMIVFERGELRGNIWTIASQ
jgi:Tol biopolymer transport system component